jgi:serine/threonine protein kinase
MHHPSLVSLSSSFSTPDYTALVLSYCPGGELFDFLADWHQDPGFTEGLARRIFGELCDAVGWMHECGLVHRDIKLESTSPPLSSLVYPTNEHPQTSY